MIQSPLYQEIVQKANSETLQQSTLVLLEDRFGPESKDLEALLRAVSSDRLAFSDPRGIAVFACAVRTDAPRAEGRRSDCAYNVTSTWVVLESRWTLSRVFWGSSS